MLIIIMIIIIISSSSSSSSSILIIIISILIIIIAFVVIIIIIIVIIIIIIIVIIIILAFIIIHPSQTELIWFNRILAPATDIHHTVLNLGPDCSIKPSDVVRDLGVLLDNTLSLKFQIASITKSCFFHLRRIRQVKKSLNENCLRTLVQALVISRLDYCNSVLYGLPASTLQPLTTVLHCAAKLIKNLSPRDHVTPTLS